MRPLLLAICTLPLGACAASQPAAEAVAARHLFYLHGRIIEDEGVDAVSPVYGPYRFAEIVARFEREGYAVHAPVRGPDADPGASADAVVASVQALIAEGVPPEDITVMGASKGSYIASLVSHRLTDPQLRYVLLASCAPGTVEHMLDESLTLHGHVLAIRDSIDTQLAGSCQAAIDTSPDVSAFDEIVVETGLEHGLIYTPNDAWVLPALDWAAHATPTQ